MVHWWISGLLDWWIDGVFPTRVGMVRLRTEANEENEGFSQPRGDGPEAALDGGPEPKAQAVSFLWSRVIGTESFYLPGDRGSRNIEGVCH
jgi:hypothetical protein